MNTLSVLSYVDPRDLAINKRYRSNKNLPQVVKDAKENLAADVFEILNAYRNSYEPPEMASVFLAFTFPSRKNDLDGPLKHTLDALQDGIRRAGWPEWNDRSIQSIHIQKYIGVPRIHIQMLRYGLV